MTDARPAVPSQITIDHGALTETWDILASAWVHEGGDGWLPTFMAVGRVVAREPGSLAYYAVWDEVSTPDDGQTWLPSSGFFTEDKLKAWTRFTGRASVFMLTNER